MRDYRLRLFVLLCGLMYVTTAHCLSSPESISADKGMAQLMQRVVEAGDSPSEDEQREANKNLLQYMEEFAQLPKFLHAAMPEAEKAGMKVVTAQNGKMRIFSWDTHLGGSMVWFWSVLQYEDRPGSVKFVVLNPPDVDMDRKDMDSGWWYESLQSLTDKDGGTIYLARANQILSGLMHNCKIHAFRITHGQLTDAKVFKTPKQSLAEITTSTNNDPAVTPRMVLTKGLQTLKVPLISAKSGFTNRYLIYKFDGKQFVYVPGKATR